jgi:hypothetical protein
LVGFADPPTSGFPILKVTNQIEQSNVNGDNLQKLLGGIPTPLKNMSQLGLLFPTEWKIIKFHGSKPPENGTSPQ